MAADLYPIFLRLWGRRCLVVGGGKVAARKARGLLRAGARVTAVAPAFGAAFPRGARKARRVYRKGEAGEFFLAFAATDDPAVNAAVARDGRKAGVLVNSATDAEGADFHVPAALRRGSLVVAFSTSGLFPGLSRALRKRLEGAMGPGAGRRFSSYLAWAAARRRAALDAGMKGPARRCFLRRLANPLVAADFERRGRRAAERKLAALLDGFSRGRV